MADKVIVINCTLLMFCYEQTSNCVIILNIVAR